MAVISPPETKLAKPNSVQSTAHDFTVALKILAFYSLKNPSKVWKKTTELYGLASGDCWSDRKNGQKI